MYRKEQKKPNQNNYAHMYYEFYNFYYCYYGGLQMLPCGSGLYFVNTYANCETMRDWFCIVYQVVEELKIVCNMWKWQGSFSRYCAPGKQWPISCKYLVMLGNALASSCTRGGLS